jgi:hypothetical protein
LAALRQQKALRIRVLVGFFMWAKVGRKELCQGGVLFGSLMSGGIFELGDTDEGGMEG